MKKIREQEEKTSTLIKIHKDEKMEVERLRASHHEEIREIILTHQRQIRELQSRYNGMKRDSQKKISDLQNTIDTYQAKLKSIESRRMFKLIRIWWKLSTSIRYYFKKYIVLVGYRLDIKTGKFPKINKLLRMINRKIGFIKNFQEAVIIINNEAKKLNVPYRSSANSRKEKDTRPIKNMKIACILDEFSFNSFKYECHLVDLHPGNWRERFEQEKPEIFFCESAWSGSNSRTRPWKGQIYSSSSFAYENRKILLNIIKYCNKKGIPTVFWNKEDPAHFNDEVHNFVDTALKFDFIFTTAEECVSIYRRKHGHPRVNPLMFAVQPRIFNPIEKYQRTDQVIFAGSWYRQHPKRSNEMKLIFDQIVDSEYELLIYNRHSDSTDPNHKFPGKYRPYIKPALEYENLDQAYKSSRIALNINTVQNSKTMFARRVFELMASNTHVISNQSAGMEYWFKDKVSFLPDLDDHQLENIDNYREWCLINVLKNHTYRHRLIQLLKDIGNNIHDTEKVFEIYFVVNHIREIMKFQKLIPSLTCLKVKLFLLISPKVKNVKVKDIYSKHNSSEVGVMSMDYMLKYCPDYKATTHFMLTQGNYNPDFLKKAQWHSPYAADFNIFEGSKKYSFKKNDTVYNVLFKPELFIDVINSIANNLKINTEKYII